jgi:UDP-glucose 4-epimerase
MKKILITGANSYIGTSFEKWLLQYPNEYLVDTVSTINNEWKDRDFSRYDVVFNVAGIAHVDARPEMESLYYKVNRDFCIELANKAKEAGVSQFVFMSSMIVFSNLTPIITKDTVPNPRNFYGNSKLEADEAIQKMNCNSFNVASVRPPMVYGPNCKGNFQKLADFATKSPIFPDINNNRSMIFIDNLCEFVRLVIDNSDYGVFYPQNREYVNVSNAVQSIANLYGRRIYLTKLFNPIIQLFLRKINILNKVFGSYVYEQNMSDYHNYEYCVSDFYVSLQIMKEHGA